MTSDDACGNDARVDLIRTWWDEAKLGNGVGLVLPDGWFGSRQYDTVVTFTYILLRPHKLLIELDDRHILSFTGPWRPAIEGGNLVITDWVQLVFDWQAFATTPAHAAVFTSGRVTFVNGFNSVLPPGSPP